MMVDVTGLTDLRSRATQELTENILPYWLNNAQDVHQGGFLGRITSDNIMIHDAPKGAVLNTRILWTFAAAHRLLHDAKYLDAARRAYFYLDRHFRDKNFGGIYWMLKADGSPLDTKKQIYAQAFAIYALSEYHRIMKDRGSLAWAIELFQLIEKHSYDPEEGGYFEAYSRDWVLLEDLRLSKKDANEKKTMNTHLHVLEGYTNLYRAWPDAVLKERLRLLIDLFLSTILDNNTFHLRLFFDEQWNVRSNIISYGHDIEASWLILEAAEVVDDALLIAQAKKAASGIAEMILSEAIDADGAIFNEWSPDEGLDDDKHWWPQAEAVVGFVNAYQTTSNPVFLRAAIATWSFIEKNIIDQKHGEWFARTDIAGKPVSNENKVGPWKGPYHNARMCMELMTRTER